jgi:hypothetical protein
MNLKLCSVRHPIEVLALKVLPAGGAVRDPLGVGFAPLPIVKKHPSVSFLWSTSTPPRSGASARTNNIARPPAHLLLAGFVQ